MNKLIKSLIPVLLILLSLPAQAGTVSGPASITMIRPYVNGVVYIYLTPQNVLCETNVFSLNPKEAGFEAMYSAVLSAFMAGKSIKVEEIYTGCNGWGTGLQSVYLLQ